MKKILIIILIILNIIFYIPTLAQHKQLILNSRIIAIDAGHGGKDNGTSYKDIYEKNINLDIAILLKKELEKYGATIIMTRTGDYDLSYPNAKYRKKSDFDNRIKLINEANSDFFISIHQNYYNDSKYEGTQIFYKGNKELAKYLQDNINSNREIKQISDSLYMYNKLKMDGILIECGFLSNSKDRKNFTTESFKKEYVKKLSQYIIEYFRKNS